MKDILPRAAALRAVVAPPEDAPAVPAAEMLTVAEAARYLRISKWSLYRLIRSGELKSVKIRSRRLISQRSIQQFVAQLEARPGESGRS